MQESSTDTDEYEMDPRFRRDDGGEEGVGVLSFWGVRLSGKNFLWLMYSKESCLKEKEVANVALD